MLLANFVTTQGHNCILGNVYNSLNYFHIDISESDIFFWTSSFQGDRNLKNLFESFYEERGECSWLEFVEKSLSKGQPVLVSVNHKALPYIKLDIGDPSTKHYINIIGLDVDKRQIYVSDSYIPTYKPSIFEGWIGYVELSDTDIENCWCLKREFLDYFQNESRQEEIQKFTLSCVISRLSEFLEKKDKRQGVNKLRRLQDTVLHKVANRNYDEMFMLLAGIRLNTINPLIYLRHALEYNKNASRNLAGVLDALISDYWETLNIRLIKFALAHKNLDVEKVSEQMKETILQEEIVLGEILKLLIEEGNGDVQSDYSRFIVTI